MVQGRRVAFFIGIFPFLACSDYVTDQNQLPDGELFVLLELGCLLEIISRLIVKKCLMDGAGEMAQPLKASTTPA